MIISEKQVMQLISIVGEYTDKLKSLGFDDSTNYAFELDTFLGSILKQQNNELNKIE